MLYELDERALVTIPERMQRHNLVCGNIATALWDFAQVDVSASLKPGREGNLSVKVEDPDGHTVDFVQYLSDSLHSRSFGKFLPDTRVSEHVIHVGVTVRDRAAADKFYKDILGFKQTWQGGMKDDRHRLG